LKTKKPFILFMVFLIIITVLMLYFGEKRPMSGYTFISLMERKGFIVINNLREDSRSLLPERKIDDIAAVHSPIESYTAIDNELRTEMLYQIFPSEDDAILLVNLYKNLNKLDVTNVQKVGGYNIKNEGNSYSNRNGINYQRTFIRDFNDRYFLVSRIDNSLLIASIDSDDLFITNLFFKETGY